ncbi:MAG TPA: hypothetical protein VJP80_08125 [Candidatus Saccharimonadales bacterium]|nr:hypothetical protein [Candidatus Saccharimonadales bacterium]
MNRHNSPSNTERGNFMTRIGQRAKGRLGRWATAAAIAGVAAGGVTETYNVVHKHNQARYETIQREIAPVIKDTMIKVDQQTLEQQRAHPDDVVEIDNPDGHSDAVKFVNNTTSDTEVVMGVTDGKPDPNKPLFVDYRNNTGTGENTIGIQVIMTAPGGNDWVDKIPHSGFDGTTGHGWGAAVPGQADTTSRGYGGDSMPAPLDAAQQIAQTAQQFGPYQPYSRQ